MRFFYKFIGYPFFCIFWIIFSFFFIFISLPILIVGSFSGVKLFAIFYDGFFIKCGKILCGVNFVVHGAENIPHDKRCIIVSKHSSMWETIFFFWYFRGAVFVLKKEIFKIPLTGRVASVLGMIAIDRSKSISALTKIIHAIRNTKMYPLIIFPQGTRVRQMAEDYSLESYPYKKGVIAMSKGSGLPVVVVSHNASLFWGRGLFSPKTPGTIDIQITNYNKIISNDEDLDEVACIIEEQTDKLFKIKRQRK